jgi:hypothetical protein
VPAPGLRPGAAANAEGLGVGRVEQAQQIAVRRARALLAAFPLGHHVGVDADALAVSQPCQAGHLVGPFLLRPAAFLA